MHASICLRAQSHTLLQNQLIDVNEIFREVHVLNAP